MGKTYNVRPSNLLNITDEYTAYCLDEACAYMIQKMEKGEEPIYYKKYSSFSDLYSDFK